MSEEKVLTPLYKTLKDFKEEGYVFIPSYTQVNLRFSTDFYMFCRDEGIKVAAPSTIEKWLEWLLTCLSIEGKVVTFVCEGKAGSPFGWEYGNRGYFVYGDISKFKSKLVDLQMELNSPLAFDYVEQIAEQYALELEMEFAP